MKTGCRYGIRAFFTCLVSLSLFVPVVYGQKADVKEFRLQGNLMLIRLSKGLSLLSLDSFVTQYKMRDLGLYSLLYKGETDSLVAAGWSADTKTSSPYYLLTKKLGKGTDIKKTSDRVVFSYIPTPENWRRIGGNRIVYGINRFRGASSFRINGDTVFFLLPGFAQADNVKLAGNFTNWQHNAFPMTKTNQGWEAPVLLQPGQYYYKFIIDGKWITDPYNLTSENDGFGNINSVFYVPNKTIILTGHPDARTVYVTGSFNNYVTGDLPMHQVDSLWRLSLYLQPGTHRYRFVVDGKIVDPSEPKKEPSAASIAIGKSTAFFLPGFNGARNVYVAGEFNEWRKEEISMDKTANGWATSYVLGPGNYQYKFVVDGRWLLDPANPAVINDGRGNQNSYLVVEPNHTFRLQGFTNANSVYIAGSFNNWSPKGLRMKRVGNEWVCSVYLGKGKHSYKFVVDGRWLKDPANPLWEDDDDNSVLWKD